jgi:hypothetical protein
LRRILTLILIGIFAGCTAFSPAVTEAKAQETKKTEKKENTSVQKEKTAIQKEPVPVVQREETIEKMTVVQPQKNVSPDMTVYSISNLNITEKNNGVLIQLAYTGNDPRNNITTFFSGDNFFNITFYKGKFKPSVKKYIYNKAIVRSVKFIEFKESVQITVWLKQEFKSSFVATDEKSINISLFN